jgi:hypothetical protein
MWTTGSNEWVNLKKRGKKRPEESGAGELGEKFQGRKADRHRKGKGDSINGFFPSLAAGLAKRQG